MIKKLNEERGKKTKEEIDEANLDEEEFLHKHITFCTCCCWRLRKYIALKEKSEKDK